MSQNPQIIITGFIHAIPDSFESAARVSPCEQVEETLCGGRHQRKLGGQRSTDTQAPQYELEALWFLLIIVRLKQFSRPLANT